MSHDTQGDGVLLALAFSGPFGAYDAVGESGLHVFGVRTVAAVDLDSSRDADESEYLVTVDGVAAARQREVKSLQILVDHQYVVLVIILAFHRLLQVVGFGASVSNFVPLLAFPFLEFQVLVDDGIDIHGLVGNALIEVGDILVAQLADESHQYGFIVFQLAVLELAFQGFLGKLGLLGRNFLQGLADLGARLGGRDEVQPVSFRSLCARSDDLHLITAVQGLPQRNFPLSRAPIHRLPMLVWMVKAKSRMVAPCGSL